MLMMGGWPADHLCTISELSGLLGSRALDHEIYVVFQVSRGLTVGLAGKTTQFSKGDRDEHWVSV